MRNQGRATSDSQAYHCLLVYVPYPRSSSQLLSVLGEYWVVNQVLAKQLHSTSEEVLTYTTNLMDKLEQVCHSFKVPGIYQTLTAWAPDQNRIRERGCDHRRCNWSGLRRAVCAGDTRQSRASGEGQ